MKSAIMVFREVLIRMLMCSRKTGKSLLLSCVFLHPTSDTHYRAIACSLRPAGGDGCGYRKFCSGDSLRLSCWGDGEQSIYNRWQGKDTKKKKNTKNLERRKAEMRDGS